MDKKKVKEGSNMKSLLNKFNEFEANKKASIEKESENIENMKQLKAENEKVIKEKKELYKESFNEDLLQEINTLELKNRLLDEDTKNSQENRKMIGSLTFSHKSEIKLNDIIQDAGVNECEKAVVEAKKAYLEACSKYAESLSYVNQYKTEIREAISRGLIEESTIRNMQHAFLKHFVSYSGPQLEINAHEEETFYLIRANISDLKKSFLK